MNKHLPECPVNKRLSWFRQKCICPALRACEKRLLEENFCVLSYNHALDAARQAVEHAHQRDSLAVRSQTEWGVEIALAAIDALGKK